jgi:anion-transporting  ArsA/GET3 family ATPase
MMQTLSQLVGSARILVCVGRGGVGKTTMSALLARQAAASGRRALVLTIDPARRLADALGIAALTDEPVLLNDPTLPGEMWAAMLKTDEAFAAILRSRMPDADARASLEANRFYRFFATSLAGAHELAAAERLHDLATCGRYDLVVLDTPPALHASDFLDAPKRFHDALDSAAFHWLTGGKSGTGRRGIRIGIGLGLVQKTLARFTGTEFLHELTEFLSQMSALMEGFKTRAAETTALIRSEQSHFVLITAPASDAPQSVSESAEAMQSRGCRVSALIVNRMMPSVALLADTRALTALLQESGLSKAAAAGLSDRLRDSASEAARFAESDEAMLRQLEERWSSTLTVEAVRAFPQEVSSLAALDVIRSTLFPVRAP